MNVLYSDSVEPEGPFARQFGRATSTSLRLGRDDACEYLFINCVMTQEQKREIVSRRVFKATPERLWEMFANPEHLAARRWPKGFTNAFHEFNFVKGGVWRFTMQGPDGIDYENKKVFVELDYAKKIVFDHEHPEFHMVIELLPVEGGTEMVWYMSFPSQALYEHIRKIAEPSNEENFDRLETIIIKLWIMNEE